MLEEVRKSAARAANVTRWKLMHDVVHALPGVDFLIGQLDMPLDQSAMKAPSTKLMHWSSNVTLHSSSTLVMSKIESGALGGAIPGRPASEKLLWARHMGARHLSYHLLNFLPDLRMGSARCRDRVKLVRIHAASLHRRGHLRLFIAFG